MLLLPVSHLPSPTRSGNCYISFIPIHESRLTWFLTRRQRTSIGGIDSPDVPLGKFIWFSFCFIDSICLASSIGINWIKSWKPAHIDKIFTEPSFSRNFHRIFETCYYGTQIWGLKIGWKHTFLICQLNLQIRGKIIEHSLNDWKIVSIFTMIYLAYKQKI